MAQPTTKSIQSNTTSSNSVSVRQTNNPNLIIEEVLGDGSEAIVYRASYHNTPVAYKRILKPFRTAGILAVKEIVILSNLNHINVIKLIDVLYKSDRYTSTNYIDDVAHIVLPLALYDLDEYIDRYSLTESAMVRLMVQMLSAVQYVHTLGIIHRDIKPDNFLVYNEEFEADGIWPTVKLCDFGHATLHHMMQQRDLPNCAPGYRAPEIMVRGKYHTCVDVWALGSTFYWMLTRKELFSGTPEQVVLEKALAVQQQPSISLLDNLYKETEGTVKYHITQHSIRSSRGSVRSTLCNSNRDYPTMSAICEMILSMLTFLPSQRPTIAQIIQLPVLANYQHLIRVSEEKPKEFHIVPANQESRTILSTVVKDHSKLEWLTASVAFTALHLLDIIKITGVDSTLMVLTCLYLSHKYYNDDQPVEIGTLIALVNDNSISQRTILELEHRIITLYLPQLFAITPYDILSVLRVKLSKDTLLQYFHWCCINSNVINRFPSEIAKSYLSQRTEGVMLSSMVCSND